MDTTRKAVVMRYASICAKELSEKDPEVLAQIADEKREIENTLGMSTVDIISEAQSYFAKIA